MILTINSVFKPTLQEIKNMTNQELQFWFELSEKYLEKVNQ
jgi:hypothetical protein